ncbi:MAG: pilus assembly FimT family protein [Terrimicrobiaceae bacterium]
MLAVGLCAILAVVSVPAMEGWMAEHRLRSQADEMVKLVQSVKLDAEKSGQRQLVVLRRAKDPVPEDPTLHALTISGPAVWSLRRIGGGACAGIGIDARGYVDPVSLRVAEGDKFIEYQFDFLTGHARETEASF